MLIIRLQRTGARNAPDFRIVLAEKHRAASKKVLEVLGQYNPVSKKFLVKNEEKLKTWLNRNVELSPTVHNLLIAHKLLDAKKVKAWRPKVKSQAEASAATQAGIEQTAAVSSTAVPSTQPAKAEEAPAQAPKQVATTEQTPPAEAEAVSAV